MLAHLELPDDVELVRTTPTFTAETVPAGLLRDHKVAPNVWGRLRVISGTVTFISDETGESRALVENETQVIEPDSLHHVIPGDDARFHVEFHRGTA